MRFLLLLCILQLQSEIARSQAPIDLQGHRGARGLYPENTIPAMLAAVDMGVTTLELDVVISKDRQVVVSHEPWINSDICFDTTGQVMSGNDKQRNMYAMDYQEIARYDCGSKVYNRFPQQQKMRVHKPLLSDLIAAVEQYCRENGKAPVHYNIEIKSQPETDGQFHPTPDTFAVLVLDVLAKAEVMPRTTIQSFDLRPLQYIHAKAYPVQIAYLTERQRQPQKAIEALGFVPHIYSPYYKLVTPKLMNYAKEVGMRVIPWTVNAPDAMQQMLELGVDGIITDYPNVLVDLLKSR